MSRSIPTGRNAGRPAAPHSPVEPGTPAFNAILSLGAAEPPPPRHVLGVTIDGERITVETHRPLEEASLQLQRKVYMKSVRDALKNGDAVPAMPEHLAAMPDSNEARSLQGRKHMDPASFDVDTRLRAFESDPMPKGPNPPPFPGMQETNGWHMPLPTMPMHYAGMTPMPMVRLSDSIRPFLKLISQKRYSRPAVGDHMLTFRIMVETIGNKVLSEITHPDMDEVLEVLAHWPTNATVRRAFREMRAPEIAMKARKLGVATLSLKTQQRHIDRMKAFFRFCERRRELFPGLLDGVRVYRKAQDFNPGRDVYTDTDLATILGMTATQTMTNPVHYWGPRLALYLGLRVNEAAQLYIDDVTVIDGIPCIEVTKLRAGQRIKNRFSHRVMPIHPELLRLGFMRFVAQAKSHGRKTLFPLLSWGANGPGDTLGDWYNGSFLRKTCGITDRLKTFHSFRHTFATLAERSRLPDGRIALLLGHSAGASILREHYVKPPTVEERMEDLMAIRFPDIDQPVYDPAQFEEAFKDDVIHEGRKQILDGVYGAAALQGPV